MPDIPNEIQKTLIDQKLQQWRNTLFAVMADVKVAAKFADAKIPQAEQMIEQAKTEAKRCEIAIETLQAMLDELSKSDAPTA